ncbi:ABC transporter ATP-binding protein [Enterococcus sp. BWR-S5]|uniref:ABC transporter ATP-binding protein n=1 Tax=Enterococcus sp. BWR-S5 TaxID=2787714 RepID=UPI001921AC66|nr:ABC transporter ATP-binding protein [Enterococcus sp. BWR-S5]MBL1224081.1 ABC transporter ATP-binding protein [Enterococcus sp. BWR-S5]
MGKIIKRMSISKAIIAIIFLLIQAGCDLYIPTLTASMINQGVVAADMGAIIQIGGIMLSFSLASVVAALLNTYISAKVAYRLGNDLREAVYRKITAFSNVEFDRFSASSLITRNTNDVTQVQSLVEMGLKFLILTPIYLIGGIYLSFRLSPALTSAYLIVVPILLGIAFLIFHFTNPLFEKMQTSIDNLNRIFKEGLTGIKVIHAFNKEEAEYQRYEAENASYTKVSIRSNTILNFLMPFMSLAMSLVTIAITWFGAGFIDNGSMEIGTLIGVTAYTSQILMGVALLTNIVSSIPRGQVSARRINEVLDLPLALADGAQEITEESAAPLLTFDHVSFRYEGAEKDVLEAISFTVNQGESLAIIGSTGSGKTTLVNLLSRFYTVSTGTISLSGQNINELKESSLRNLISLVPQKNTLFFGTVRDNLLLARPEATDEQIWQALELAKAADFVQSANGLDTAVEKNGDNFSGGQRQRLCLARAFLKEAAIYIFDDSFSALDFKTDALIQQNLRLNFQQAVKIIVAQRIATVRNANKILVMNEGKIVGYGTHEELAATNAVYQEIMQSQTEEKGAAA